MNATPRSWMGNANRTPWVTKYIAGQLYIETVDQNAMTPFIADMRLPECQSEEEEETTLANADLIVRAVNSYEAMREALETLCKQARTVMQYTNEYDGQLIQAIANGEAALALANGSRER